MDGDQRVDLVVFVGGGGGEAEGRDEFSYGEPAPHSL